jgi:hypothetical protein
MKKLLFILITLPCIGFGTQQTSETIIYNGITNSLLTYPLSKELREKLNVEPKNTGCWRGYIGQWELKDNKLYLTGLREDDGPNIPASVLFKDAVYPLQATWFSGELRIPFGEVICDQTLIGVHVVYKKEVYIPVANGTVNGEIMTFDNSLKKEDFIAKVNAQKDSGKQIDQDQYAFTFHYSEWMNKDTKLSALLNHEVASAAYFNGHCSVLNRDKRDLSHYSFDRLSATSEDRIYKASLIFDKIPVDFFRSIYFVAFANDKVIHLTGHLQKGAKQEDAENEAVAMMVKLRNTISNQSTHSIADSAGSE